MHKHLLWSRAARDEAYGNFLAARDGLRALYCQIDLEKDRLEKARRSFGKRNMRVKKQLTALRDMCLSMNIPNTDPILMAADSSDYKHDTDSLTEESSEDERITRATLKKSIATLKVRFPFA